MLNISAYINREHNARQSASLKWRHRTPAENNAEATGYLLLKRGWKQTTLPSHVRDCLIKKMSNEFYKFPNKCKRVLVKLFEPTKRDLISHTRIQMAWGWRHINMNRLKLRYWETVTGPIHSTDAVVTSVIAFGIAVERLAETYCAWALVVVDRQHDAARELRPHERNLPYGVVSSVFLALKANPNTLPRSGILRLWERKRSLVASRHHIT